MSVRNFNLSSSCVLSLSHHIYGTATAGKKTPPYSCFNLCSVLYSVVFTSDYIWPCGGSKHRQAPRDVCHQWRSPELRAKLSHRNTIATQGSCFSRVHINMNALQIWALIQCLGWILCLCNDNTVSQAVHLHHLQCICSDVLQDKSQ